MTRYTAAVNRDDLTRATQLAYAVIDDDSQPDELRNAAVDVSFVLSEALCYQFGVEGQREIRLIPIGMKWPQFYSDLVSELLVDLGEEVCEGMPAHVLMARQIAKYVDDMLFSTDFRLDAYDCLNQILASLKAAADDDDDDETC